MKLPQARTTEIVVQNLQNEVLIYDLKSNQAFCLNETAAKVFESCDGVMTFDELKIKYRLTDEIIYLALDGLSNQDLLESEYVSPFAGLSRREVIRKVGLASMIALPLISALIAPSAAAAASDARRANNQICTTRANGTSTECQSGNCVDSTNSNGGGAALRCCAGSGGFRGDTGLRFSGANQDECTAAAQQRGFCCSGAATFDSSTNDRCICT